MLIQGETSVGKTSLIHWLAAATGNQCVRINNHEHTDIQEYIGCYSSDSKGKLVFKEGTSRGRTQRLMLLVWGAEPMVHLDPSSSVSEQHVELHVHNKCKHRQQQWAQTLQRLHAELAPV